MTTAYALTALEVLPTTSNKARLVEETVLAVADTGVEMVDAIALVATEAVGQVGAAVSKALFANLAAAAREQARMAPESGWVGIAKAWTKAVSL